jgi:hypothetical protein
LAKKKILNDIIIGKIGYEINYWKNAEEIINDKYN